MKKFFFGIIVIAGALAYGMFSYHFILFDDSLKVLKKADTTLEYTFVDARGAGKAKLLLNPALVKAGVKELLRRAAE